MSRENFTTFEKMLREDGELQAKLQEATGAYDGGLADERALFEATLGKVAAELGLPFTYEEAGEVSVANKELADDELDAVAGGWGICLLIGGSSAPEAGCGQNEGHACAYVGVTIIDCTK